MRDIARFFVRYQIDPENLLYLTREEQRTVLHLLDGSTVTVQAGCIHCDGAPVIFRAPEREG